MARSISCIQVFSFNTYQAQIGAISYYALELKKMQINTVKFRQKIYMYVTI